jgi:hypothetical protein
VEEISKQNSSRAKNAVLGGALGALGGAVAAFAFTSSTCQGATADSFCGLMLFFLGPTWTLADGIAGAFAGAIIARPPRASQASWIGAVLGMVSGITVAVMGSIHIMPGRGVAMSSEHLRQIEDWVLYAVPLVIAAGGILGGTAGNRLRATLTR